MTALSLIIPWGAGKLPISSWVLVSGHKGQQKIPLVTGETKEELKGQEKAKAIKMIKGSTVGRCGPPPPH